MNHLLAALILVLLTACGETQGLDEGKAAFERGDYAAALREFRPLAEQGDANAQYNLGIVYAFGHSLPQDYAEAVKWFHKAAEQDLPEAQHNLGVMYQKGRGVQQDYAKAVKWYRKAAQHGNIKAQTNLGAMYEQGKGIPQDYAEAVKWFRLSAELGDDFAQYNLGLMHEKGQGVPKSSGRALDWFRKAAAQGNANAQQKLQEPNYRILLQLFRKVEENTSDQRTEDPPNVEPGATDTRVCDMAIRHSDGEWEQNPEFRPWVDEVRNRGLKLKDCGKLLKAN